MGKSWVIIYYNGVNPSYIIAKDIKSRREAALIIFKEVAYLEKYERAGTGYLNTALLWRRYYIMTPKDWDHVQFGRNLSTFYSNQTN